MEKFRKFFSKIFKAISKKMTSFLKLFSKKKQSDEDKQEAVLAKSSDILEKKYGARFKKNPMGFGLQLLNMADSIQKRDKKAFSSKKSNETAKRIANLMAPFVEGTLKLPGGKEKIVDTLIDEVNDQLKDKYGKSFTENVLFKSIVKSSVIELYATSNSDEFFEANNILNATATMIVGVAEKIANKHNIIHGSDKKGENQALKKAGNALARITK